MVRRLWVRYPQSVRHEALTVARVRPLRKATTPIEGESARGLFCRALGRHGVPLSFTVLRRLGAQHRNRVTISEDPDIDFDEMARIIGVDVAEIEHRRYRPLGQKRYSFFGLELPSSAIEKKVRRFSPGSLATSPHIRAVWELRDLPFCPESWELLIDSCVCRVRQGWIRLNGGVHRCDDCGRLLANTPTHRVPEGLHHALSLVAGLASPLTEKQEDAVAMLPPLLRGIDRTTLFECVLQLRRALAAENSAWPDDVDALHEACAAMLAWPLGIGTLRPAATTTPTTWTKAVARYNGLVPSVSAAERRKLGNAALQTSATQAPGDDPPSPGCKASLIGIRPAYELARLTPETVLAARERGHLGHHERLRGGEVVVAFDPEDVIRFAEEYRARISGETIAYDLGIGRRAVQDISACGHMEATGISLRDDELWFSQADVSGFVARLRAARVASIDQPVRIKDALLSINGRAKPWGAVVGRMLAGDLPFTIADGARKLFDAILLDSTASASISTLESAPTRDTPVTDRITQGEALEILNANITCRALDVLKSAGRNPITFSLSDVERLAQAGVSVLEVAGRTGLTLSFTYHAIKRQKIDPVADGLWNRRQVGEHFPGFNA